MDWYWLVRQHPLQDEWWEVTGLSHEHVAGEITVPTQVIAGWQDEATAPNAASRLFAHLLTKVTHKKLVYTNGGHGAVGLAPVHKERIRWMDHWLKGENNGVDTEPPVTVFWEVQRPSGDSTKAVPNWTTTYPNWPPPNLQRSTLYLTADAMLSREQPAARPDQGVRSYLYPAGTELIGNNTTFAVPPYPSGSLNYRTEPMSADLALLGNPEVTFYFSSEQKDTDFMVTLKDVDLSGNTLYLTKGLLRASLRAIDPARSWPDEVTQSFRKVEELVPGQIYEAKLSLWTIGHIVRQGHQLELSILAPNPIPALSFGAAPVGGPSVNKVYHSPQYASKLVLPVVPGEHARAAAPDCGTLWNQPCRKAQVVNSNVAPVSNWQGGFVRVRTADGLTEQDVYREYGYVPMKDGVRLAYSAWRPKKEGRYPTLFQYSAYADDSIPFSQAKPYLEAGYAYLGANVRGSGCSEGADFVPFTPTEGKDGAQIVEWAAAQPWSTGNVGMVGNSYSGSIQYAVAAEHPPHLKALSAAGSNTSRYRDWLMIGGMFHQGNTGTWGLVGNNPRTGDDRRVKEWGDSECAAIIAKQKPMDWYWLVRQHPLQDEWWEVTGLSHEHVAGEITVPTQVIAGWQDEATAPNAASRLFAHLLTKVTHKKLVYTNGGHGAVGLAPVHKERIRWMDHWLKGENNGVDTEPPVTVFWEVQRPSGDSTKAVPNWTTTYPNWPPPNLQRSTLYLTADAMLSREQPAARPDQGVRSYLYPAGTELIGNNTTFAVPPYPSGSLNYRTEPMSADLALLGNPEVTFYFSSEQKDTDFMVTLKDVDLSGNTLYLTKGLLRASLRAIDPARSWPDEVTQSFRKANYFRTAPRQDLRLDPIGERRDHPGGSDKVGIPHGDGRFAMPRHPHLAVVIDGRHQVFAAVELDPARMASPRNVHRCTRRGRAPVACPWV